MARVPVTELSFPKRNLTWHGVSFIDCKTCLGRCLHKSSNCDCPITDKLAPKSTMPSEPSDTKYACSTKFGVESATSFRIRGSVMCGAVILVREFIFSRNLPQLILCKPMSIFCLYPSNLWLYLLRCCSSGDDLHKTFSRKLSWVVAMNATACSGGGNVGSW